MKKRYIYTILLTSLLFIQCKEAVDPGTQLGGTLYEGIMIDRFNGEDLIVYANSGIGVMAIFSSNLEDGTPVEFKLSNVQYPNVFESTDGTTWNVLGKNITDPSNGPNLVSVESQTGYWFSFSTFFPVITLVDQEEQERLDNINPSTDWLVNSEEVFRGAAKDGIPAISSPKFISGNSDLTFINNFELVTVVQQGNEVKAYPHKILDWHEIVNDEIGGEPFVLSYCPLTGTSDAWKRTINGEITTFGVSGFLYNDNLILYDRNTDSNWSQILRKSINGSLIGDEPERITIQQMTWEAAKKVADDILILSNSTGFDRNYSQYPYGDYLTSNKLLYPISYDDNRVFSKERVLHVSINGKSKVYQFTDFEEK